MELALVTHKVVIGDGQGRINYEVTHEALRRGHKVTLVSSEVEPELANHSAVTWVRIPVQGFPTELLRNQVFALQSSRWLNQHRDLIDLVLGNGAITWVPVDVNAVHMVHSAWLQSPVHTARVERGPYGWYQWLYTVINATWERRAFEQARMIIAVSDLVRDQICALGVLPNRVRVISNGVQLNEFTPGPRDRRKLGLPDNVPLAIFAGDIRRALKNLDTVLHALTDTPGIHLIVAGSTDNSPYPAMTDRLGLSSRVHFLGFRRDLPELMRAADFFVFPSRYESFSLVLLEAMATGLPVVTARTVGAANLVSPECGVVLEDPNDQHQLAEAMRALAANPEQRLRMGRAGRAVAEMNSFDAMARQYLELLEEMHASETALVE